MNNKKNNYQLGLVKTLIENVLSIIQKTKIDNYDEL